MTRTIPLGLSAKITRAIANHGGAKCLARGLAAVDQRRDERVVGPAGLLPFSEVPRDGPEDVSDSALTARLETVRAACEDLDAFWFVYRYVSRNPWAFEPGLVKAWTACASDPRLV